ncbi:hypothetical protein EVU96_24850 [Bacillus infantis]|uniref:phage neck terminator protein n=1 Tax=Bacillus infantis TaxID=324767 RepID=UPI00101BB742|nr:hypothetical protein [Bacillus infantis]RYI25197.1 hypothetical protein EVU96_24850 [Bacillus infantis]
MINAIKQIIARIKSDTGISIVQANSNGAPKPPLPYGVYNITSPYIKGVGREDLSVYEDENGLYQKRTEQYRVTLSFNLYGNSNETTIDLALKVRKWFLFLGQDFIEEQNIAVTDIGNIENRTTFLVDSYEYKQGFDVQLRLTDEQVRVVDWIEKAIIEMEE